MRKTCFVVMGFGKKMDYRNSREIDLDIIYKEVIKKLFSTDFSEYELIRADEISGSEIIDISMYSLLIKADLVIADITTSNENALYELGIRHALKPFSTIIMMQKSEKFAIPFDLNHNRILAYDDYGESLDQKEAIIIRQNLKRFIINSEKKEVDSPFYIYLPNVIPPTLDDEKYEKVLQEAKDNNDTISKYMDQAEQYKKNSNFIKAIEIWEKLHEMLPNNDYITQQLAFAHYKSEYPTKTMSLQNALEIMNTLKPEDSLDLETLGITGAIYKRLYAINHNFDYLDKAIDLYKKGYIIRKDYYNGENYANCLLLEVKRPHISKEEVIYLKICSRKVYEELINIILFEINRGEINYWMYATLAASYYCLGNIASYKKYEELFIKSLSSDWEKETYYTNLESLKECIEYIDNIQ